MQAKSGDSISKFQSKELQEQNDFNIDLYEEQLCKDIFKKQVEIFNIKQKMLCLTKYLNSVDKCLLEFVNQSCQKSVFANVSEHVICDVKQKAIDDIKNLIGVDVKTFSYIINSDVIRLIQNRYLCNNPHGSLRSINERIAGIAYIIQKYDKVFVLSKKTTDGMLVLQYEKNIGLRLFIVDVKVDIANCRLQITDMYQQKTRK